MKSEALWTDALSDRIYERVQLPVSCLKKIKSIISASTCCIFACIK